MSLFSIAAKFALKGASKRVPEDIMSGTIRRIKQEASLPETPSRVFGKDPERYTGPHSDFKRIVEDYVPFTKVDDTQDVLRALGHKRYPNKNPEEQIKEIDKDIKIFKQPTSKGGQKLTKEEKKVYSNPKLEKEARNLDEGLITLGEFKEMRDILKPRRTYGTVPKLFDDFDILGSIGQKVKDHGIIGVNKNIKQGTKVDTRFDINAYKNYGRYVVTIRKDGDVFGYAPTAILKNVKFAGHIPPTKEGAKTLGQKAFNVAKREETKNPFAVMEGKWQDVSPESTEKYAQRLFEKGKVNKAGETDKEWTEIGFDPSAKTSFYNRSTGEPIFEAEKVVQVGSMLLARGIKKATPTQLKQLRFSIQSGKELEGYKQGGQVSEGLSSIVSRAKGGKTKRKKKDKDFYADFDRKGKPIPELLNRIAINKLMEDLEWERIPKEVKRKRREEAEQWEDMKFIQEAMKEDNIEGSQMFMPNQDLYKNPIFKDVITSRKGGGGLSNLKKSININGQPHSLAWINPGEASALRAMGGSGKKVEGIPAYFDAWSMGLTPTPEEQETAPEPKDEYDYPDWPSDEAIAKLPEAFTYKEGVAKEDQDDFWNRPSDEPTEYQKIYDRPELNVYKTALLNTGMGGEAMEAHMKGLGLSGLRQMVDKFHTGYDFGGPMGTMEGLSRNIASDYASKLELKKYLKDLEDLKGKKLPEEDMETRREELISAFRDHAKEIGGEFIPSTKFEGIMSDYQKDPRVKDSTWRQVIGHLAPGALMTKVGAAGLNALTSAFGVIGEFITPEGKSFRVMDDGTLVAPDIYADTDEGTVERKPERKPPPLPPPAEPLEQKLTGMEAHYANLPKAASRQASLQSQFDILAATYGREQAAALLNQPVNIFA